MLASRWNALSSTRWQNKCGFAAWLWTRDILGLNLAPSAISFPSSSEKSIHLAEPLKMERVVLIREQRETFHARSRTVLTLTLAVRLPNVADGS